MFVMHCSFFTGHIGPTAIRLEMIKERRTVKIEEFTGAFAATFSAAERTSSRSFGGAIASALSPNDSSHCAVHSREKGVHGELRAAVATLLLDQRRIAFALGALLRPGMETRHEPACCRRPRRIPPCAPASEKSSARRERHRQQLEPADAVHAENAGCPRATGTRPRRTTRRRRTRHRAARCRAASPRRARVRDRPFATRAASQRPAATVSSQRCVAVSAVLRFRRPRTIVRLVSFSMWSCRSRGSTARSLSSAEAIGPCSDASVNCFTSSPPTKARSPPRP